MLRSSNRVCWKWNRLGVGIVPADTTVNAFESNLDQLLRNVFGYTLLLMATHDSELTALYMETTNIVDSLKVVKGTDREFDILMQ